jgi:hypothetical protein
MAALFAATPRYRQLRCSKSHGANHSGAWLSAQIAAAQQSPPLKSRLHRDTRSESCMMPNPSIPLNPIFIAARQSGPTKQTALGPGMVNRPGQLADRCRSVFPEIDADGAGSGSFLVDAAYVAGSRGDDAGCADPRGIEHLFPLFVRRKVKNGPTRLALNCFYKESGKSVAKLSLRIKRMPGLNLGGTLEDARL